MYIVVETKTIKGEIDFPDNEFVVIQKSPGRRSGTYIHLTKAEAEVVLEKLQRLLTQRQADGGTVAEN